MKGRQSMKTAKTLAKRPKNYRMLLLAKRAELSSSLRAKLDTLAGTRGAALEDLAPVFSEQFTALRINRLDYLQLKLVEGALARIDSQEYGVCVDCGDAISSSRLQAIPWALRCIGCQELVSSDNDARFANDSAQLEEMSA
jgi:DnaK suppressor protein